MATWFARTQVSIRRIEDLIALDPDIELEEVAKLLRYTTTASRWGPTHTLRRMLRETDRRDLLYTLAPPKIDRFETTDLVHELLEWNPRADTHDAARHVGKSWAAIDICLRRTGNQKTVNKILRNTTERA